MGTKTENDKTLEELRKVHGAVAYFVNPAGGALYVFRTPDLEVFELAQARLQKGEPSGPVNRELCLQTLVHPAGDQGVQALEALFKKAPLVPPMVADELANLAKGGIEVLVKKE